MLILRCTQKLQKRLRLDFEDAPHSDPSLLGAWYANLLPDFEDVAICVNERTRLTVLVELPRRPRLEQLVDGFRNELGWLLLNLGLSGAAILRIMDGNKGAVCVARTQGKSRLGTMNDFASIAGYCIDEQLDAGMQVDLRSILPQLNDAPLKPLGWKSARKELERVCAADGRCCVS